MEIITIKLDKNLLRSIDANLSKYNFSTRTEFVRDAIRQRLTDLEKEEVIRKLAALKGIMKGKARMSHEEAGELAFRKIAKNLGVKLD